MEYLNDREPNDILYAIDEYINSNSLKRSEYMSICDGYRTGYLLKRGLKDKVKHSDGMLFCSPLVYQVSGGYFTIVKNRYGPRKLQFDLSDPAVFKKIDNLIRGLLFKF